MKAKTKKLTATQLDVLRAMMKGSYLGYIGYWFIVPKNGTCKGVLPATVRALEEGGYIEVTRGESVVTTVTHKGHEAVKDNQEIT